MEQFDEVANVNATLEEIREICGWANYGAYEPDDIRRLIELVRGLDESLRAGGALPDAWAGAR